MPNLTETGLWESGVYQLEIGDPVIGGEAGMSNVQPRQLANRTSYLKSIIDNILGGTTAVEKANKLSTARSITLSGIISGSANFDGSANISISASIADGALGIAKTSGLQSALDSKADISILSGGFVKPVTGALFTKVNAYSISIPVGTKVLIGSSLVSVSTTVTLSLNVSGVGGIDTGTKAAGTDYNIYALSTGEFILSISKTAPLGYTTANSKRIGGFHYGVIPEAFTAINNITSADATKIAGINQYSFWDLKFRPICDPSGMAYIFGRWYDLYLCNVDHHTYGTSAAGKTIAGGTVLNGRGFPKIPLFYGGDGSVTYGTFTWFEAAEIAKAHSKDLISYNEFVAIAYGVLEASSASTADTGITQHLANYTSKFGICMATGCQWIWGKDLHMRPDGAGWSYHTETEGRGSLYAYQYGPTAAVFGGFRDHTSYSGSRASVWHNYVWVSDWSIGCRFACDHLELA